MSAPEWKREIEQRLANVQLEPAREAAIVEELAQHLDDCYEELLGSGVTPAEAHRQTLAELDESETLQRELRRGSRKIAREPIVIGTNRRSNMIADLWRDLRYGARMLMKNPGFTAIAVITLALGIGINSAMFTFYNAFLLKPLPVKDPDALVKLEGRDQRDEYQLNFSYRDYLDYRDRNTVLDGLVAFNKLPVTLGEAPPAWVELASGYEYVIGQIVSENYFSVLGARMALGRAFLPDEDETLGTNAVVVLGYHFWQRRFNGDPSIINKTIKLHGHPFTVIGIAAPDFIGTMPDATSLWIPLLMRDRVIPSGRWAHRDWFTDRQVNVVNLLGRLKPGITREQAQAELSRMARQLAEQYPDRDRKTRIVVRPNGTIVTLANEMIPVVIMILIAFGLVLLIACANVANMLLARAATRQKEIGVRLAVGASRWRLIRQLLTESVLLSALGGLAGLLLTIWAINDLYPVILASQPIPQAQKEAFLLDLDPDYRVFGFSLLVSLIVGIASGLTPALQASRPDLTSALKEEGSTFGRHLGQSRLRNTLVVTQIAVCLMLLVGAGLLVRNLWKLQTIDTGMETKNVISVALSLKPPLKDQRKEMAARRQFAERVRALPGVKSVSLALRPPLHSGSATTITIPGREPADGRPVRARYIFVSPEYFDTVSLQLLRGRVFTAQEVAANAPVVVISEATARRFWANEDAIGKQIGIGAAANQQKTDTGAAVYPSFEVIGIAKDSRNGHIWRRDETFLYVPLRPDDRSGEYILVRAGTAPEQVMAAVRGEAEAAGNLSFSISRVEDWRLDFQMAPFRGIAMLAGTLGILALLLACIGLYGVMSFIVAQRTREIGIRVALGADARDVVILFLRQGLRLIAAGLVIGIAGGAGISRLLAAALTDLSPLDPIAFGGVSACLALVALLACYIPARRATKVDPMIALRCE
jgi:macrolide transport system ATP-binding/permease protein